MYFTNAQEVKNELLEVQVTPPTFMVNEKVNEYSTQHVNGNLQEFIAAHFNYTDSKNYHYSGVAILQFTVMENGHLDNFEIINSVYSEIDNALIETLKMTNGMWNPGTNNGEAIAMQREVSVAIHPAEERRSLDYRNQQSINQKMYQKGNKLLFVKNNPKKALNKYNYAIRYQPNDEALWIVRGFCHYQMGEEQKALKDWERVKDLSDQNLVKLNTTAYSQLHGFNLFAQILNE